VLYELHSRGGLRVVAGGEQCGIKPGMPLAEAAALAEVGQVGVPFGSEPQGRRRPLGCRSRLKPELQQSHPSPLLLPHDPVADREALAELAVWCERFSPAVAIEATERPDGLALDATVLVPLFGSEAALAERVAREFHERRLSVRVTIADTLGAAWAVAHEGRGAMDEGRRLEISIVLPGESLRALAPLSVAALRLPEETIALLAAVGISTIGQLAALPRSALSSRFGPELLAHLDWAAGEACELLLPHRAVPQIAAEWGFETPIDSLEAIEQVLEELIRRASAVLAKRDEGALGIVCRMGCGDGQQIALAVGLFRPSASPKHLWELLKLKLETIRLAAPVAALAIEVTSAAALSHEQQELFTPDRSRDAPRHLSALIERLSSRLGREAVVRPVLMPDAQPEFASIDWPWTGERKGARGEGRGTRGEGRGASGKQANGKTNSKSGESQILPSLLVGEGPGVRGRKRAKRRISTSTSSRPAPGVRPIWLAESPLPLSVISVVPAGPPAQFHFDGADYRVARTWGPERIETGWWRMAGDWGQRRTSAGSIESLASSPQSPVPSPSARRDYYRVETTSGRRFWLFRRLTDARWFLHGEFG
jgi:protein ImuB